MKETPNSCPWCAWAHQRRGGADPTMFPPDPRVASINLGGEMAFKVGCPGCFANGPAADSDRTAILLWNRVAKPITTVKA